MIAASPPQFVTFDDLMAAASGVKNMSLAHEIAVDANFKFEKLEPHASRSCINPYLPEMDWSTFQFGQFIH